MDYDALAKKYGGSVAPGPVDYDALAKQYGGELSGVPGKRAEIPVGHEARGGAARAPEQEVPRTFMQRVAGTAVAPLDVAATMADAAWRATWANPVVALATGRTVEQVAQDVRRPQTPEGAAALEYLGKATSWLPPVIGTGAIQTGLAPGGGAYRAAIAEGARPMVEAVERAAAPVTQALRDRQLVSQGAKALESYARGPQIDAAKDAQRLGLALNPTDIDPTSLSPRAISAAAGPRGAAAIEKANRPKVNEIARQDMGLPPTEQLNGKGAFDTARANVAGPYNEVNALPITVADDAVRQRLESLRLDPGIIGPKEYASSVNAIIDSAIEQTGKGLTGEQLLKNVRILRERARRTYNNKNATVEALDIADTNMGVASALEMMIDANISDPALLSRFRDARQKMARIYTYEAATDFNTGLVDASKIARLTAKDNALTGDLAALGRVAGNFPSAFKSTAEMPWYSMPRLQRSGLTGAVGAGLGSNFGLTGSIVGGTLGAGVGELGSAWAARRMASPGYQAGLNIPDFRLPVNQLAAQAAAARNRLRPEGTSENALAP